MAILDEEIAKSELLMSVAPIRLVSVGGSLAVCLTGSRQVSYDIDCILDPNVAAHSDYADEFRHVVGAATEVGGLWTDWLNRQVETFVARERRHDLFLESVEQDITVYSGENLVIYAGRLDWALERKIRRISYSRDRRRDKDVDVSDAAALIKYMIRAQDGKPLSFEFVRGLNYNGFDLPPTGSALKEVADYYAETYGEIGLAEIA